MANSNPVWDRDDMWKCEDCGDWHAEVPGATHRQHTLQQPPRYKRFCSSALDGDKAGGPATPDGRSARNHHRQAQARSHERSDCHIQPAQLWSSNGDRDCGASRSCQAQRPAEEAGCAEAPRVEWKPQWVPEAEWKPQLVPEAPRVKWKPQWVPEASQAPQVSHGTTRARHQDSKRKSDCSVKSYAFVSLLYGNNPSYALSAAVLGHSLKANTNHDMVLMYTNDVENDWLRICTSVGWKLRLVKHIKFQKELYPTGRFSHVFTKLHAVGMEEYDKVIVLDTDVLVRHDMDELFEGQTPAAVRRLETSRKGPISSTGAVLPYSVLC